MKPDSEEHILHKYRKIETIHKKGGFLTAATTKVLIVCSECGDAKVIEL